MLSRPVLRQIELRLARGADEDLKVRSFGEAEIEYHLREMLDQSRYLYGMHEYVTASAFVANVAAGSLVLDIGANIGEYAVLAARDAGRVIAYEPNPAARARLLRNVTFNQLSNVEISPQALGSEDRDAILRVPQGESGLGTLRAAASGSEYTVELRRLDGLMSDQDISQLGMLKVDVEGLELEVFQGAHQTITKARPLIFYECAADSFEVLRGRSMTPAMQFLAAEGYDNFVVDMTRRGRWALRRLAEDEDPLRYREPWEVLMVIAVPSDSVKHAQMHGTSVLRPCGVLELLGRH
jgi:FkbM family methyltransferase